MALVLLLLLVVQLTTAWNYNQMIGKGQWIVMQVFKCPNDEKYPMKAELTRKKVNRTHDGFNLYIDLDRTVGDEYGIAIEACKYVDGGCKAHQMFADDCACCFLKKYGGSNMRDVMALAGLDPPECPIPPGIFNTTNYVFDYGQLPEFGIYGTYDATVYILEPRVKGEAPTPFSCVMVTVRFDSEVDRD